MGSIMPGLSRYTVGRPARGRQVDVRVTPWDLGQLIVNQGVAGDVEA